MRLWHKLDAASFEMPSAAIYLAFACPEVILASAASVVAVFLIYLCLPVPYIRQVCRATAGNAEALLGMLFCGATACSWTCFTA